MRLINADALIKDIKECIEVKDGNFEWEQVEGLKVALSCVEDAPTIEPERKKGHWILIAEGSMFPFMCDQCKERQNGTLNFCPECGADMRGGQDEWISRG